MASQPDERKDQHARQGGERRADDPGGAPDPDRARGLHRQQVRIVHDGAHRGARAGPAKEYVQASDGDHAHHRHDQLGVGDVDPADLEGVGALGEELRDVDRVAAVLDRPESLHDQDQPGRRHDLPRHALLGEAAADPFHAEPHQRSGDDHRDDKGYDPVDVVGVVHGVEDVRRGGGQRPLAEVEDPRGLIGEDQAGSGQAVDGPGRYPRDDEGQELLHVATSGAPGGAEAGGSGPTESGIS